MPKSSHLLTLDQLSGSVSAADGRNTISSQILAKLREAIVSGEMKAGSKINLDQVKTELQVSLSPLREAMARLTADGLVQFEDNRGYRVAPVSLADFQEVGRLREQFETFALREAIKNGDLIWESGVIRSLHLLNRTEREANSPKTLESWEEAHRNFHLQLISGCNMPLLIRFCSTLLNMHDRYRRTFLRRTSGDRNVESEHSNIAQAAVARDVDYACNMLGEHLSRTTNNLQRYLAEHGFN